MSKINIKIMGTDPFSKQVLVSCKSDQDATPFEDLPLTAFPHDFLGSANAEEFLENIKTACEKTVNDRELLNSKEFLAEGWVGKEASLTPAIEDTSIQEFLDAKKEVYAKYPPANMDVVRGLCATDFNNMMLLPLIRGDDATVIGVYVNYYAGSDLATGAKALKSIKEATELCLSLGVPMCGGTIPSSGLSKERFTSYLSSISEHNKFISSSLESYVYQDWSLDLAQNRKKTIINSERKREIDAGITFAGYDWDSDEASRNNLTNYISASGQTSGIWRTKDNQNVTVDLVGLSKALADHVTACFEKSWARKEALKSTTTFGEVDAI